MPEYKYVLDNRWEAARERLAQLEAVWDPWTMNNLTKIGVQPGWHCLEAAGGGGSIAAWLCRQVVPTGSVLATDLEPHFLEAIGEPNLRVARHDILADPLPAGTFDLVHTRALLAFLPEPHLAIRRMVDAVKPGGWLLIEEPDYVSAIPDPSMTARAKALSTKGWNALLHHLRSRGYDTEFGRHLYSDLVSHGLADVQAEGFVAMQVGGKPSARFWRITLEQIQDQILSAGLLTELELEEYRLLLEDSEYRWFSLTMMSAWGRRPM